jgi:hypothetical protein
LQNAEVSISNIFDLPQQTRHAPASAGAGSHVIYCVSDHSIVPRDRVFVPLLQMLGCTTASRTTSRWGSCCGTHLYLQQQRRVVLGRQQGPVLLLAMQSPVAQHSRQWGSIWVSDIEQSTCFQAAMHA